MRLRTLFLVIFIDLAFYFFKKNIFSFQRGAYLTFYFMNEQKSKGYLL